MGYMHIQNLYKETDILLVKECCYALEKIHGCSAHISYTTEVTTGLRFHSGGEKHDRLVALFDVDELARRFAEKGRSMVVYGEAYGGGQQKQAWRYGPNLKFVAFEVKIGDSWLSVDAADRVATSLGLEFVHYARGPATVEWLDSQRDAPSQQARRNGVEGDQRREGVVIRPLIELTKNDGSRLIAKHKRPEERETATPRVVGVDPIVTANTDAACEWVTTTRLEHVLDHLRAAIGRGPELRDIPAVVAAMQEDVFREGTGEVVDDKSTRKAVGRVAVELFKARLAQGATA